MSTHLSADNKSVVNVNSGQIAMVDTDDVKYDVNSGVDLDEEFAQSLALDLQNQGGLSQFQAWAQSGIQDAYSKANKPKNSSSGGINQHGNAQGGFHVPGLIIKAKGDGNCAYNAAQGFALVEQQRQTSVQLRNGFKDEGAALKLQVAARVDAIATSINDPADIDEGLFQSLILDPLVNADGNSKKGSKKSKGASPDIGTYLAKNQPKDFNDLMQKVLDFTNQNAKQFQGGAKGKGKAGGRFNLMAQPRIQTLMQQQNFDPFNSNADKLTLYKALLKEYASYLQNGGHWSESYGDLAIFSLAATLNRPVVVLRAQGPSNQHTVSVNPEMIVQPGDGGFTPADNSGQPGQPIYLCYAQSGGHYDFLDPNRVPLAYDHNNRSVDLAHNAEYTFIPPDAMNAPASGRYASGHLQSSDSKKAIAASNPTFSGSIKSFGLDADKQKELEAQGLDRDELRALAGRLGGNVVEFQSYKHTQKNRDYGMLQLSDSLAGTSKKQAGGAQKDDQDPVNDGRATFIRAKTEDSANESDDDAIKTIRISPENQHVQDDSIVPPTLSLVDAGDDSDLSDNGLQPVQNKAGKDPISVTSQFRVIHEEDSHGEDRFYILGHGRRIIDPKQLEAAVKNGADGNQLVQGTPVRSAVHDLAANSQFYLSRAVGDSRGIISEVDAIAPDLDRTGTKTIRSRHSVAFPVPGTANADTNRPSLYMHFDEVAHEFHVFYNERAGDPDGQQPSKQDKDGDPMVSGRSLGMLRGVKSLEVISGHMPGQKGGSLRALNLCRKSKNKDSALDNISADDPVKLRAKMQDGTIHLITFSNGKLAMQMVSPRPDKRVADLVGQHNNDFSPDVAVYNYSVKHVWDSDKNVMGANAAQLFAIQHLEPCTGDSQQVHAASAMMPDDFQSHVEIWGKSAMNIALAQPKWFGDSTFGDLYLNNSAMLMIRVVQIMAGIDFANWLAPKIDADGFEGFGTDAATTKKAIEYVLARLMAEIGVEMPLQDFAKEVLGEWVLGYEDPPFGSKAVKKTIRAICAFTRRYATDLLNEFTKSHTANKTLGGNRVFSDEFSYKHPFVPIGLALRSAVRTYRELAVSGDDEARNNALKLVESLFYNGVGRVSEQVWQKRQREMSDAFGTTTSAPSTTNAPTTTFGPTTTDAATTAMATTSDLVTSTMGMMGFSTTQSGTPSPETTAWQAFTSTLEQFGLSTTILPTGQWLISTTDDLDDASTTTNQPSTSTTVATSSTAASTSSSSTTANSVSGGGMTMDDFGWKYWLENMGKQLTVRASYKIFDTMIRRPVQISLQRYHVADSGSQAFHNQFLHYYDHGGALGLYHALDLKAYPWLDGPTELLAKHLNGAAGSVGHVIGQGISCVLSCVTTKCRDGDNNNLAVDQDPDLALSQVQRTAIANLSIVYSGMPDASDADGNMNRFNCSVTVQFNMYFETQVEALQNAQAFTLFQPDGDDDDIENQIQPHSSQDLMAPEDNHGDFSILRRRSSIRMGGVFSPNRAPSISFSTKFMLAKQHRMMVQNGGGADNAGPGQVKSYRKGPTGVTRSEDDFAQGKGHLKPALEPSGVAVQDAGKSMHATLLKADPADRQKGLISEALQSEDVANRAQMALSNFVSHPGVFGAAANYDAGGQLVRTEIVAGLSYSYQAFTDPANASGGGDVINPTDVLYCNLAFQTMAVTPGVMFGVRSTSAVYETDDAEKSTSEAGGSHYRNVGQLDTSHQLVQNGDIVTNGNVPMLNSASPVYAISRGVAETLLNTSIEQTQLFMIHSNISVNMAAFSNETNAGMALLPGSICTVEYVFNASHQVSSDNIVKDSTRTDLIGDDDQKELIDEAGDSDDDLKDIISEANQVKREAPQKFDEVGQTVALRQQDSYVLARQGCMLYNVGAYSQGNEIPAWIDPETQDVLRSKPNSNDATDTTSLKNMYSGLPERSLVGSQFAGNQPYSGDNARRILHDAIHAEILEQTDLVTQSVEPSGHPADPDAIFQAEDEHRLRPSLLDVSLQNPAHARYRQMYFVNLRTSLDTLVTEASKNGDNSKADSDIVSEAIGSLEYTQIASILNGPKGKLQNKHVTVEDVARAINDEPDKLADNVLQAIGSLWNGSTDDLFKHLVLTDPFELYNDAEAKFYCDQAEEHTAVLRGRFSDVYRTRPYKPDSVYERASFAAVANVLRRSIVVVDKTTNQVDTDKSVKMAYDGSDLSLELNGPNPPIVIGYDNGGYYIMQANNQPIEVDEPMIVLDMEYDSDVASQFGVEADHSGNELGHVSIDKEDAADTDNEIEPANNGSSGNVYQSVSQDQADDSSNRLTRRWVSVGAGRSPENLIFAAVAAGYQDRRDIVEPDLYKGGVPTIPRRSKDTATVTALCKKTQAYIGTNYSAIQRGVVESILGKDRADSDRDAAIRERFKRDGVPFAMASYLPAKPPVSKSDGQSGSGALPLVTIPQAPKTDLLNTVIVEETTDNAPVMQEDRKSEVDDDEDIMSFLNQPPTSPTKFDEPFDLVGSPEHTASLGDDEEHGQKKLDLDAIIGSSPSPQKPIKPSDLLKVPGTLVDTPESTPFSDASQMGNINEMSVSLQQRQSDTDDEEEEIEIVIHSPGDIQDTYNQPTQPTGAATSGIAPLTITIDDDIDSEEDDDPDGNNMILIE